MLVDGGITGRAAVLERWRRTGLVGARGVIAMRRRSWGAEPTTMRRRSRKASSWS